MNTNGSIGGRRRAVNYFCGAGGSSLGMEQAGFDVVGFDSWPIAVRTHVANGLEAHVLDLSDPWVDGVLREVPGGGEMAWISAPCQPFSGAGKGLGEADERDGFPWALRILAATLPKVAIFENVKGLTFKKHADYLQSVLDAVWRLGYSVEWGVMNCADYGVPQTRERCIIIARRDGGEIRWPDKTHCKGGGGGGVGELERWRSMADALGWEGVMAGSQNGHTVDESGDRLRDERSMEDPAFAVTANALSTWKATLGKLMGTGMVERHGERPERGLDEPAFAIRASGGGRDPGGVVWTHGRPAASINGDVRVSPPGHHDPNESGSQQRGAIRLEIEELAALQDFPREWKWCGTKTDVARQIGNAVPPRLARLLCEANVPL